MQYEKQYPGSSADQAAARVPRAAPALPTGTLMRNARSCLRGRRRQKEMIYALAKHRKDLEKEEEELAIVMALPRAEQREKRARENLDAFGYKPGTWWRQLCVHYNPPGEERCNGKWHKADEEFSCNGTKSLHFGGLWSP